MSAIFPRFTWANPEINRLENQVLVPFFSEDTSTTVIELGLAGHEHTVADRLRADSEYVRHFTEAYGKDKIDVTRIAKALAVFQTTFISYRSPYDRGVMNEAARRGELLFRSSKAGCASCHGGWNFNEDEKTPGAVYLNAGLYNVAGKGDYPDALLHGAAAGKATQGLFVLSQRPEDRGRFRIPSLRNAGVTAPYMHDGSVATLEEAIEHFNQGGRTVGGALAGDGRQNPNKDSRIRALGLSPGEVSDLAAFLRSLTDDCFLTDPRYSDPSGPVPVQPAHCL
jgi:cytochrome c peroxidase